MGCREGRVFLPVSLFVCFVSWWSCALFVDGWSVLVFVVFRLFSTSVGLLGESVVVRGL